MTNSEEALRDAEWNNGIVDGIITDKTSQYNVGYPYPGYDIILPTNPPRYPVYTTDHTNITFKLPKKTLTKREEILNEAAKLITSDRQEQYGPPEENFQNIADVWNVRFKKKLSEPFTAADVAHAMALLKIVRDVAGYKEDSAIDAAAYVALYAELSSKEPKA